MGYAHSQNHQSINIMQLSLLDIRVILHYYYSPEGVKFPDESAASIDSENEWTIQGCLYCNLMNYTISEKGMAFVAMLLNTPIPQMGFVDPRNQSVVKIINP